jgi:hypothetical protein
VRAKYTPSAPHRNALAKKDARPADLVMTATGAGKPRQWMRSDATCLLNTAYNRAGRAAYTLGYYRECPNLSRDKVSASERLIISLAEDETLIFSSLFICFAARLSFRQSRVRSQSRNDSIVQFYRVTSSAVMKALRASFQSTARSFRSVFAIAAARHEPLDFLPVFPLWIITACPRYNVDS